MSFLVNLLQRRTAVRLYAGNHPLTSSVKSIINPFEKNDANSLIKKTTPSNDTRQPPKNAELLHYMRLDSYTYAGITPAPSPVETHGRVSPNRHDIDIPLGWGRFCFFSPQKKSQIRIDVCNLLGYTELDD